MNWEAPRCPPTNDISYLASRSRFTRRDNCPVCATPTPSPFFRAPLAQPPLSTYLEGFYGGRLDPRVLGDHHLELCRCPDCSLVFQAWVPDDESLERLYGEILSWNKEATSTRRGLATRLHYMHDLERVVRFHAREPSEVHILDFGAGAGLWLDMAKALGCRTAGAELDPQAASALTDAGHRVYGLNDLPTSSFDFINAEQVFEHLAHPVPIVKVLAAALRPGGLLRISVPNGSDIEQRLRTPDWEAPKGSAASLNAVAPLEHINCFDHRALVRLGTDTGLRKFRFPLRTEVHPTARLRFAVGALKHRLRPPSGTLVFFQRAS